MARALATEQKRNVHWPDDYDAYKLLKMARGNGETAAPRGARASSVDELPRDAGSLLRQMSV